ncbi:SRPBCC domain-containing protein [Flavobacteriaceae bacterium SZ-1-7]|uniref:SRPBCC domain-containing protein n=1 Tax=Tamlana sedimenti TaxID=3134126 RepID=UPI003124C1A7
MNSKSNLEIFNARTLNFPVEEVYRAFAEPTILKNWWGPHGFTNTIHEFDLKPSGKWILTMHGPEKGNYENSSVFEIVKPNELVRWKRISQPWFDMEIAFTKIADSKSQISFRMIFKTVEECNKIRGFAEPKNEENFDRLEQVLANL